MLKSPGSIQTISGVTENINEYAGKQQQTMFIGQKAVEDKMINKNYMDPKFKNRDPNQARSLLSQEKFSSKSQNINSFAYQHDF